MGRRSPLAASTRIAFHAKITIERAVNAFLAAYSESSALGTQRMNRYFMNRFRSFSEDRGYVLLDQWGPIDVREFRASLAVAARAFFEFALDNEWIARNPTKLIKEGVVTYVWRRKLLRLWALCGSWPERPTPRCFRHTFPRILLQKANVTIRDVAEFLGNTEEIVRKHYEVWVPEGQARITRVLRRHMTEISMKSGCP
jgi:hypothetical protein